MDTPKFSSLFTQKSECILYKLLEKEDESVVGWIGGYPPIALKENKILNQQDVEYKFYLTFILPLFNKQVSIFIPSFEIYLNNDIYPNNSIQILIHDISMDEYSINEIKMEELKKHFIVFDKTLSDNLAEDETYFIKLGGKPILIQNKSFFYEQLNRDGFNFLFQIDEYGYPDSLLNGNAPFGFGALYAYALFENNDISKILAGYWQTT